MSTPGFIILAHERFDRVAELARYLGLYGPVVVHVDRRANASGLHDLGPRAQVISNHVTEWGKMGLIDATLDAARILLSREDVGHVCLLSGADLPIRPADELVDHLASNRDVDFIESVAVDDASWVQGGLSGERLTLWHPVSWRKRRRLFNLSVELQRRMQIRRRIPDGLTPHLGLQWWCLTSKTLRAILERPQLKEWRQFFRWSWIPDESFFQTLVRFVPAQEICVSPLTLQRFDERGRPFVFYEDHAAFLDRSGQFFARKIDPDAGGLYAKFLSDYGSFNRRAGSRKDTDQAEPEPFKQALQTALETSRGLLGPSKIAAGTSPTHVETARPYAVLVSRDEKLMREIRAAYRQPDIRFHGRLFGVFPADFSADFTIQDGLGPGCMPTDPVQRDYRPAQYLAKVLWVGRERPTAFLFHPSDRSQIRGTIYSDPNARLILLGDQHDLLNVLSQPLQNRKGRYVRAPEWRAWHQALDPQNGQDRIAQALSILSSDWQDAAGWTCPNPDGVSAR